MPVLRSPLQCPQNQHVESALKQVQAVFRRVASWHLSRRYSSRLPPWCLVERLVHGTENRELCQYRSSVIPSRLGMTVAYWLYWLPRYPARPVSTLQGPIPGAASAERAISAPRAQMAVLPYCSCRLPTTFGKTFQELLIDRCDLGRHRRDAEGIL